MQADKTLDLTELIFKIAKLMRDEMSFDNDFTHLSVMQIHTLMFLSHSDKAMMSDIADYLHVELPSATSLISKLSEQGLVERLSDPEDRRLVRIVLTKKGKDLTTQAKAQRRQKLKKFLSYLSDQDKLELYRILGTIQNKLEEKS